MIDIAKSETSTEDSAQQAEPLSQQQDTQTQPAGQPLKLSFTDLSNKISSMPATINQSLDDGVGDSVIHAVQNVIKTVVMAVFSSCRIISLRACLLSEAEKNVISKIVYAVSLFLLAVFLIALLVSFSWGTLLLNFECLGAAYVADRVIHISHIDLRKKRIRYRNISSHKSNRSHSDDDDYL